MCTVGLVNFKYEATRFEYAGKPMNNSKYNSRDIGARFAG